MKFLSAPLIRGVVSLGLLAMSGGLLAQAVADREGAVRGDRAIAESFSRWIYNDYELGFAEAKRTGKPLLVVIRCLPCKGCMGIDASILEGKDMERQLDQFICVRLINANALDLARFQFDYDLSFSTIFFNADGTVYGRYGSWTHQKDASDSTTEGYQAALKEVLAIHRAYPANKAELAGKQGGPAPFKTPVEIPALAGKYGHELDWTGNVVKSCVHCHQIGDAFRNYYRDQGKTIPLDLIYPMPMPETVGLSLATDSVARVTNVAEGSAAASAGIQAGDDIVSLAGQHLISIADFAWALHRAPNQGQVDVVVKRDGALKTFKLALAADWRLHSDIGRRVGTWPMRAMATGGLKVDDLTDEQRAERGLGKDGLALQVIHVGQYGPHAAAMKAGFKKDDLIVELDGSSARETESEMIGRILQKYPTPTKLKATVLRNGERVSLMMPVQ